MKPATGVPKHGAIWLIASHVMPTPATGMVRAWMGTYLRMMFAIAGILKQMPRAMLMRPTRRLPVQPAFHALSIEPVEAATGSMMPKRKGKQPTVLMPYGCAVKSRPNCFFMRVAMCE